MKEATQGWPLRSAAGLWGGADGRSAAIRGACRYQSGSV
ncbi:Uncharacterised protein [Acinetobacter baumannii]|nr:Uncharacterised protein [Enterobacter cloacae]SST12381.1 Uncharacterised protein [Acinetobacter baumannii]SSU13720.1 Uncharacterised protein [Acinetobacter baumannii]